MHVLRRRFVQSYSVSEFSDASPLCCLLHSLEQANSFNLIASTVFHLRVLVQVLVEFHLLSIMHCHGICCYSFFWLVIPKLIWDQSDCKT